MHSVEGADINRKLLKTATAALVGQHFLYIGGNIKLQFVSSLVSKYLAVGYQGGI